MVRCFLTTFDNPYNPYEQFEQWYQYDMDGHCERFAWDHQQGDG